MTEQAVAVQIEQVAERVRIALSSVLSIDRVLASPA
jgi:hypothetical protein